MPKKEKLSRILAKVEIVIAALLFITMLITCGMYINIKMNGKKSSLPAMSEKDKISLLRTAASENITYSDDLIEPVFVGVKKGRSMIAACPDTTSRRSIENMIYEPLKSLFSGSDKSMEFSSDDEKFLFIDTIKNSENYMLLSFYDDIASGVFLSCIGDGYYEKDGENLFFVKNLFILPDENNNLYGIAVSSANDIQMMYPAEDIDYGKLFAETYDISDGYSYFEFDDSKDIHPMLSSSFVSGKYKISAFPATEGTDKETPWIENLFDVFAVNTSFVKDFSSKNSKETVINYVEEDKEIAIYQDGRVVINATSGGILLDEYLKYSPEGNTGYSLDDKVIAVKNLINRLNLREDNLLMYSIVGMDYNNDTDDFALYLKYFAEGIIVTENAYDACFRISNDSLISAEFYAISCEKIDDYSLVLPQKYSNALLDDGSTETDYDDGCCIYAMLVPSKDLPDYMSLGWVRVASETEVQK
ncbi:MAG: hypothetical protein E7600_07270 [Ruminococcaceae bacterium]|nr:hypothetical protein [Oscillospiraceae bacterium]